jgi:hypothetical protein
MGATVARIGNFFTKDLTHTGVSGPDGTTFYSTPQEAAQAASASLPSANDLISGTPDNPVANAATGLPVVKQPNLNTKGQIFKTLLMTGLGGLAGSGGRDAGEGAARAQRFFANQQAIKEAQRQSDLLAQLRQQEIADEPAKLRLQGLQAENIASETALRKRQLELAGKKEERAPTAVDLAIAAASGDQTASDALDRLHKGPFVDRTPKTFDALVLASELETDPALKQKYNSAIDRMVQYHSRPTRAESEADADRKTKRSADLLAGQALAQFGGNEERAIQFLTENLARDHASGGKLFDDHQRLAGARAILLLRRKVSPLDEILATALAASQAKASEK